MLPSRFLAARLALVLGCVAVLLPGTAYAREEAPSLRAPTATWDATRLAQIPAEPWLPGHRGIDLATNAGAEVFAPGPGVVSYVGVVVNRPVLSILHDNGLRSSLEPVESSLTVGTRVHAGHAVGTVADEGSHCAPAHCVHWGVRRGETYLNPLDVLKGLGPVRLLPEP